MNKNKYIILSMLNNIFITIIKLIGGILGKSKTLLADAIHSITDIINDLFLLFGLILSNKEADKEHPFGHGKIENIFSLFIGIVIVFIGIYILKTSFTKESTIPETWTIAVCIITIVLKYIISKVLSNQSKITSSSILLSCSKESYTDFLSSIFILFILLLSLVQKELKLISYIDTFGSIIISLLVVYTGINLIEEQSNELIGIKEMDNPLEDKIKEVLIKENITISNIDLIKFGDKYFPIIEIYLNKNMTIEKSYKIKTYLEDILKENKDLINIKIIILPKE